MNVLKTLTHPPSFFPFFNPPSSSVSPLNVSSFLLPFPPPSLGVPPSVFFPSLFPFSSYSLSFSALALCRVSDPSQPRFSPFSLSFFLSSSSLLPSFALPPFLSSFPLPLFFLSFLFLHPSSPSSPSPFHPASTIPYPGAPRQPIGVPHSVWAGLCVGGVPPPPPPAGASPIIAREYL